MLAKNFSNTRFWKKKNLNSFLNPYIYLKSWTIRTSKYSIYHKKRNFTKKKLIFWPTYRKINKLSTEYFFYSSFQRNFIWIKKSFKNYFFIKNVKKLKIDLLLDRETDFYSFDIIRKLKFNDFFLTYRFFFFNYIVDLTYFLILKKRKIQKFFFFMHWNFKKNQRLYLNLKNHRKRNFLFLSNGFFLKYFEKKKSIRKNKSIKMLIARYVRKLYLLIKFKYTIFFIKNIPTYLYEIINIMNTPIIHKFSSPFSDKTVEESFLNKNIFNINYFIFSRNIDFSNNKTKKKGRIKRKITRKLVLESSITD